MAFPKHCRLWPSYTRRVASISNRKGCRTFKQLLTEGLDRLNRAYYTTPQLNHTRCNGALSSLRPSSSLAFSHGLLLSVDLLSGSFASIQAEDLAFISRSTSQRFQISDLTTCFSFHTASGAVNPTNGLQRWTCSNVSHSCEAWMTVSYASLRHDSSRLR